MKAIEYCGTPTANAIEVGGPNGPVPVIKPVGGALLIVRVSDFQEGDHEKFRQLLKGQPASAPAPASGNSTTGQKLARLVDEVERDLANDGVFDAAEKQRILGLVLEQLAAPELVQQLVAGKLDPIATVKGIAGAVRGLF